ncbi:MAG TPA: sulfite exporter TauE/SafE family protein [Pseudonocardiaceae bacterium]|nr:sulfite exporter TauE/SafE family protein [Pseudonocardiaceae bacterium]
MDDWFSWTYWYVLPYAVFVSVAANASGFSGAVLFQPFFNFALNLPIHQSIATGIATETVGMSSGAARYLSMRKVDLRAARRLLPAALVGVAVGLVVFSQLPRDALRLAVGLVVGGIALAQLDRVRSRCFGTAPSADLDAIGRRRWVSTVAGSFSACTGTGVAEMHQPLLEQRGGLETKRANATAILIEAGADWMITIANLSMGSIRLDILVFSATGVLVGAQVGALCSPRLPDRLLKSAFALCVLGIGTVYVVTALDRLL